MYLKIGQICILMAILIKVLYRILHSMRTNIAFITINIGIIIFHVWLTTISVLFISVSTTHIFSMIAIVVFMTVTVLIAVTVTANSMLVTTTFIRISFPDDSRLTLGMVFTWFWQFSFWFFIISIFILYSLTSKVMWGFMRQKSVGKGLFMKGCPSLLL